MSARHPKREAEARRLRSYDEALRFYRDRLIADTGCEPEDWSPAQRASFQADMDLWRSVQPNDTAEDSIRRLAERHGVFGPLNAEAFAILAVRLAAGLGEPGFEAERTRQVSSKAVLYALVCTMMDEETADGTPQRAAAQAVQEGLKQAGYDMAANSIVTRYHEEKAKLEALNEGVAREVGANSRDGGLEPRHALAVAVAGSYAPTPMERAALSMLDAKWKRLAPWSNR